MLSKTNNQLKTVLDDCEQTLRRKGFPCERLAEKVLMMRIHGKYHCMAFEEGDSDFLKISVVYRGSAFKCDRKELLERLNQINRRTKVIKVCINSHGDVEFSVEMFLDQSRYFMETFERHIEIIDESVRYLASTTTTE